MDIYLGIFFAFVSAVLWAASDFLITVLLKKNNSPEKVFLYSQLIGSVVLLVIYFVLFNNPISFSIDLIELLLIAGFLNVISYISFYKGLQVGKLSLISPISSCWVLVTVLLSIFLLNEPMDLQSGIGIMLCMSGILLTSFNLKDLILSKFINVYSGVNFAIMAALSWGILFILLDVLNSPLGWFVPILAIRMISFFMISAYFLGTRKSLSIESSILPRISLIAILDAFAYISYSFAISLTYTAVIAPISALFPLITLVLARIFLKERLGIAQKIGIGLAILGVFLLLS
jgi:drug/metabolite transporter (DMT)-like permease